MLECRTQSDLAAKLGLHRNSGKAIAGMISPPIRQQTGQNHKVPSVLENIITFSYTVILCWMSMGGISRNDRLGHAALESDRYGHPKKNCPTRLNVQVRCNWIRVPQADRFGHVTNPSQSATGCDHYMIIRSYEREYSHHEG